MKEQKRSWFSTYWKEFLNLAVLIIGFVGAIVFGKAVWGVEFTSEWKRWLALIIGELSYLYSGTFIYMGALAGLECIIDVDFPVLGGFAGALILFGVAAIFQLAFWGVVLSCTAFLIAVGVIGVIISVPIILMVLPKRQ